MEKSFDKIHLGEAAKMLSITNINTMKEYGKKVNFVLIFSQRITDFLYYVERMDT